MSDSCRFWFYIGRDGFRERGWVCHLILIPRRDLMRANEEGRLVLAALALSIGWCRGRLWAYAKSDAREITQRIAVNCGQLS